MIIIFATKLKYKFKKKIRIKYRPKKTKQCNTHSTWQKTWIYDQCMEHIYSIRYIIYTYKISKILCTSYQVPILYMQIIRLIT